MGAGIATCPLSDQRISPAKERDTPPAPSTLGGKLQP